MNDALRPGTLFAFEWIGPSRGPGSQGRGTMPGPGTGGSEVTSCSQARRGSGHGVPLRAVHGAPDDDRGGSHSRVALGPHHVPAVYRISKEARRLRSCCKVHPTYDLVE